jgi:hypothetical protein
MSSDENLDEKAISTDKAELRARLRHVNSIFAVPADAEQLFGPFTEAIAKVGEPFNGAGKALRANIDGLLSTITIPYRLAFTSAFDRQWQRIRMAEGIRSLKLDAERGETLESLESRRDQEALAQARPKMDRFVHSDEGQDVLCTTRLIFSKRFNLMSLLLGLLMRLFSKGLFFAGVPSRSSHAIVSLPTST